MGQSFSYSRLSLFQIANIPRGSFRTLHLHTTLTRASFLRLNSLLNTVSLSKQYSRYRSAQRAIARQMYLRKHLKLQPDQAIFVFINNVLPPTGALMSQIYDEHVDEDGFLYVAFSHESVFGG